MATAIVDWPRWERSSSTRSRRRSYSRSSFTTGVLRIEAVDGRPASPASRAVGIAAFAICAGLVAVGLYVMFSSK